MYIKMALSIGYFDDSIREEVPVVRFKVVVRAEVRHARLLGILLANTLQMLLHFENVFSSSHGGPGSTEVFNIFQMVAHDARLREMVLDQEYY